jgi:hypothetical protein
MKVDFYIKHRQYDYKYVFIAYLLLKVLVKLLLVIRALHTRLCLQDGSKAYDKYKIKVGPTINPLALWEQQHQ